MELRSLAASDLTDVARLYAETFNRPPWSDGWTEEAALERLSRYLDHPDVLGVVAVRDGRVCGFALGMVERWVDGEHFHLKEMCTDPSAQRMGVGGGVLEELMRVLRERGVEAIYLQTMPGSAAAAFYEKHGFHAVDLQSMIRGIDTL